MAAFYDLGVIGFDPAAFVPLVNGEETVLHGRWKDLIPDDQWSVFTRVIEQARARHVDFAFGAFPDRA